MEMESVLWSGGLGDFCGKPEGDPSEREAAGIVHGGAGILVLQGVEFLRNVLICGRLCLPKRMAEEGRPDAAGLQVRKLGNLAAESGGTCEDHGRLFFLEPAAVLAFEKLFAPKAAFALDRERIPVRCSIHSLVSPFNSKKCWLSTRSSGT